MPANTETEIISRKATLEEKQIIDWPCDENPNSLRPRVPNLLTFGRYTINNKPGTFISRSDFSDDPNNKTLFTLNQFRTVVVQIICKFAGFGNYHHLSLKDRHKAYGDLIMWGELGQNYALNRLPVLYTEASSCGLTVRSLFRCLGARDHFYEKKGKSPEKLIHLMDQPYEGYEEGGAITHVRKYAMYSTPKAITSCKNNIDFCQNHIVSLKKGDIIIIDNKKLTNAHIFTLIEDPVFKKVPKIENENVEPEHWVLRSVDGGQSANTAQKKATPSYNDSYRKSTNGKNYGSSIKSVTRSIDPNTGKFFIIKEDENGITRVHPGEDRHVIRWIDITKIEFTDRVIISPAVQYDYITKIQRTVKDPKGKQITITEEKPLIFDPYTRNLQIKNKFLANNL